MARSLAVLLFVIATALPAQADDGPKGVAIVVAPENGIWSCSAANPDAAFACARQKCREEGEADCYRIAWCYPARWGVLYTVRTGEFHGPDALCGAPDREEALATVERWCRSPEHVVSCHAFRLLTPNGGEVEIEREFRFER